jgi:hypothetical protein
MLGNCSGESESFAKGGGAHLRAGCLIGRPDPIGAARSHVNNRTALRAKYAQILAELFSVGGAVALTGRDVTFPIEHDQVAIVRSGDGIRSPRNQFAGARGRRAVQRHFRSEPMNEWLQFGEGECPQSRLRHLSGIGLAARGRVRRELLAEQMRPFSRLAAVRGEFAGRQFLHKLMQNDAAQATTLDRRWSVERTPT